jgi:hypothetical protein
MSCYNSQGYYDDDIARMKERFGIPVDITVNIRDVIERFGHKLDHYEWIMDNIATEYDTCEKHLDDDQKYALKLSIVSIELD